MTLAEAVETIKRNCSERQVCYGCPFNDRKVSLCQLDATLPYEWKTPTETNIYDEEEIHENCTVQILKNSVTGETSVGWWENEEGEE